MSFSLDTTHFKSLTTYQDALQHWSSKQPWRGCADHERPLEKRTKRHCMIVKYPNNQIGLRLHSTDLITFSPDGRVDVDVSYQSISSEEFINACLRHSPWRFLVNRGRPTAWRKPDNSTNTGIYYPQGQYISGNFAVFNAEWGFLNPAPILVPGIDIKKANAVRKSYMYPNFTAWRKVYEAMNPMVPVARWRSPAWRENRLSAYEVTELLKAGQGKWVELSQKCDNDHILQCIYRTHPEVVKFDKRDHFTSINDWQNAYNLDRKYGWAV